ncbi:hypothetical protein [Pseudomonas sp. CGJS7]|uniref:hypothetical protein n=1 Tax=Pseudomonas sp. CGJS7 TaxID=3109348 RepID=UPI003008436F
MAIGPELQAKIDALEDDTLKEWIIGVLTGPGQKKATDEDIYETILGGYAMATEQQAQLRTWRDEEVAAFATYFYSEWPERYVEFLQQERDFDEIEAAFSWGVFRLICVWMPDLNDADATGLFGKFRDYAKANVA